MWRKSNCQKQLELTGGEAGEATLGMEVKGILPLQMKWVLIISLRGKIINNNYWMRLSKISWFVGGEQINYLLNQRLSQIIDLRDTDKSWYFATTEFNNNCFIIRSPSLFFLMNILGKQSDLPFSHKSDRKKEKSTVSFTHEQNIICSQTLLDGIAHEQTNIIFCR